MSIIHYKAEFTVYIYIYNVTILFCENIINSQDYQVYHVKFYIYTESISIDAWLKSSRD